MNHRKEAALKKYCSKVKKHLICNPSTKEKLVSGLYNELLEETGQDLDYAAITSKLGSPEEIAKQLQESVGEQEFGEAKSRSRRNWRLSIVITVVLALLVTAASIAYAHHILNKTPAYYKDEIYEEVRPTGIMID